MAAGRVRQCRHIHSNDYMGISLGGFSISRLRQMVVIQRWSFEQVWL